MSATYHFALTVKRELSDGEKDELVDEMESEASSVLCNLFGGDSGVVDLKLCEPPDRAEATS